MGKPWISTSFGSKSCVNPKSTQMNNGRDASLGTRNCGGDAGLGRGSIRRVAYLQDQFSSPARTSRSMIAAGKKHGVSAQRNSTRAELRRSSRLRNS